jgi:hypothetical protein
VQVRPNADVVILLLDLHDLFDNGASVRGSGFRAPGSRFGVKRLARRSDRHLLRGDGLRVRGNRLRSRHRGHIEIQVDGLEGWFQFQFRFRFEFGFGFGFGFGFRGLPHRPVLRSVRRKGGSDRHLEREGGFGLGWWRRRRRWWWRRWCGLHWRCDRNGFAMATNLYPDVITAASGDDAEALVWSERGSCKIVLHRTDFIERLARLEGEQLVEHAFHRVQRKGARREL